MNTLISVIKGSTTPDQQNSLKKLVQNDKKTTLNTDTSLELIYNQIEKYNLALDPYKYVIKDEQLCKIIIDKNGNTENKPIANFVARVTKEITKDNGVESKIYQQIEGHILDGPKLPTLTIPSELFSSLSWLASWGVRAIIDPGFSNKEHARHAIQILSKECERETLFSHLGWRKIDGKWVYLHANGAIGNDHIKVELENDALNKYELPSLPLDIEKSGLATLGLLDVADFEVTISLLALVALTPLCEPLKKAGIMPAFVLWMVGPSGERKSSVAACFLSHFGSFSSGKAMPASFKDTANALEKKAFLTKDSLLVIDDFHPTMTSLEGQQMEQKAQMILRGYGDRVGRSRLQADTSLRQTYPPSGMCLVTGEDTPKAGNSTTARFLAIEVRKNSVNLERLTKCQENINEYSHTMSAYLEWVASKMEDLPKQLKARFNELRNDIFKKSKHGRTVETIAWLQLGLKVFLAFLKESNVVDEKYETELLSRSNIAFMELARNQLNFLQDDNPTSLYLKGLQELINSNSVRLLVKDSVCTADNIIGWEDSEFLYLIPGKTYSAIRRYYSEQGRNFNISSRMILKMLAAEGAIITEKTKEEDRRTVRKELGGKQQRVIQLRKDTLYNND